MKFIGLGLKMSVIIALSIFKTIKVSFDSALQVIHRKPVLKLWLPIKKQRQERIKKNLKLEFQPNRRSFEQGNNRISTSEPCKNPFSTHFQRFENAIISTLGNG